MKYKIRIRKAPGETMAYGGQTKSGGLDLGQQQVYDNPSFGDNPEVNNTLKPVPRELANIEAEQGETAVGDFDKDGQLEHMKIAGQKHAKGGTPLQVPDGTFVFSDTKKMQVGGRVLSIFGKDAETKKKYTPAQLAKQYDLNKYKAILDNPNADPIAKKTAELMIQNNQKKLAELALVQESMKGFPAGIPAIAQPLFGQAGEGQAPQMEMGGPVPRFDNGGGIITYTDEKGRVRTVDLNRKRGNMYLGTVDGKPASYDDSTVNGLIRKYGDPSANKLPKMLQQPMNTWNGPVFPEYQHTPIPVVTDWNTYAPVGEGVAVTGSSDLAPVTVSASRKKPQQDIVAVTDASNMTPVVVKSRGVKDQVGNSITASGTAAQIPDEGAAARRPGGRNRTRTVTTPDGKEIKIDFTLPDPDMTPPPVVERKGTTPSKSGERKPAERSVPGLNPNGFNPTANPVPFGYLTPDKLRVMQAAANLTGVNKYLPWEAAMNVTTVDPTFYDPSRELAANAEMAAMQMQSNALFAGPQALGARNSAVAGQAAQNAANTLARYNNMNVGVANQAAAQQAQTQNMEAEYNVQRANRLYQGNVIANQQYDNTKRMLGNELLGSVMNAWQNRQKMDLMNQTNQYFYIDPRTGRFNMRYGKGLTAKSSAPSGNGSGTIEQLAKRTKFYKDTYKLSDSVAKDLAEKEMGIGRVTTQTQDPFAQMKATGAGYLNLPGYTGYNPYLPGNDE